MIDHVVGILCKIFLVSIVDHDEILGKLMIDLSKWLFAHIAFCLLISTKKL